MRNRSALLLLAERSRRNEGVFSRAELLAQGIDAGTVNRLRHLGALHVIHPGVYAFGHPHLSLTGRLRAAVLHAGPGSGLNGYAGAFWYGLTSKFPPRIEVVTPSRVKSRRGLIVRRSSCPEIVTHRGLPIATVPRVLLQLAANGAWHSELRRMLSEVEYRKLATLVEVADAAGQGRRGSKRLLAAVAAHQPLLALARGPGERAFIALLECSGLPMPQINARIGRMTVDALWPEQRLVVEVDDKAGHSTAAQRHRDRERDRHLRERGFTVVRVKAADVHNRPAFVIALLARALSAATAGQRLAAA